MLEEHCGDIKFAARSTNLEAHCGPYADLFAVCQARDGDPDNFFAHENDAYPVSLSQYNKLRKCSAKLVFLQRLNDIVKPRLWPPNVGVKLKNAAAFANINKPKILETFE